MARRFNFSWKMEISKLNVSGSVILPVREPWRNHWSHGEVKQTAQTACLESYLSHDPISVVFSWRRDGTALNTKPEPQIVRVWKGKGGQVIPCLEIHGSGGMLSSLGLLPKPCADLWAATSCLVPPGHSGVKQDITLHGGHPNRGLPHGHLSSFLVLLSYEEQRKICSDDMP